MNIKRGLSIKSIFLIMFLMLAGFFGQCVMIVDSLAMGQQMEMGSEMGGCDGVCNVEDETNKEEFVLFKADPPEPKLAVKNFIHELAITFPSGNNENLYQADYASYLPPGTHSEGIRLRI